MESSPLSKLSLELRNEIYGYILLSDHPVHIHKDEDQKDVWIFTKCSPTPALSPLDCSCSELSSEEMDVTLFSVSKQMQQEAMAVLFRRNVIEMDPKSPYQLWDFTQAFAGLCHDIQMMNLRCHYWFDDWDVVTIEHLKEFCTALPMLRSLSVVLRPCTSPDHDKLWLDGILNYFRVMSALPLEEATVKVIVDITIASTGYDPTSVTRIIEERATTLLLRDEQTPPEPLVSFPPTLRKKMGKHSTLTKDTDQTNNGPTGRVYTGSRYDRVCPLTEEKRFRVTVLLACQGHERGGRRPSEPRTQPE